MDANNKDRLEKLGERPVGRLLWEYSVPAVVGMLVMALYNVVDRIFIGQWVGPDAIAGLAVTFPIMNLATAIGVLVGVGSSSRVSIVLGAGDRPHAELILGNAFTLTMVNAAIYILVFTVFIDPMLHAFGASDVTAPYGREYMLALMPGLLLTNIAFGFNNIMRASGYPRKAMATMLLGAVVNVVLDPLFIKVFDMGILGAAVATDIAMAASAWFVMWHFMRPDVSLRFRRGTFGLDRGVIVSIVSIGAAPALVNAASCAVNAIVNRSLAEWGGDRAIGAAGIMVTFTSLLVTVVLGICQGMQPIVGYNYGARKFHRLKRAYWLAVAAATVVTVVGQLVGTIIPSVVARVYNRCRPHSGKRLRAAYLSGMVLGGRIPDYFDSFLPKYRKGWQINILEPFATGDFPYSFTAVASRGVWSAWRVGVVPAVRCGGYHCHCCLDDVAVQAFGN